jgi:hypothetical protein
VKTPGTLKHWLPELVVLAIPLWFVTGSRAILVFIGAGHLSGRTADIAWACLFAWVALTIFLSLATLWGYWRLLRSARPLWIKCLAVSLPFIGWSVWLLATVESRREDRRIDAIIAGRIDRYQVEAAGRSEQQMTDDLWLAARWGHPGLVKELITEGANPRGRFMETGSTVLEAAAENLSNRPDGNAEVISLLRAPPPR